MFLFKFFRFLGSATGFGGFKLGQTAALFFLPAQLLLTLFFQFVEKVAEIVGLRSQPFDFFLGLDAFDFDGVANFGLALNQSFHLLMFIFQNLFLTDNARNLFFDQIFLVFDFFQIFADAGGVLLQIRHGFAQKHGAADYFHRRQRLHKQRLGRLQRQILQCGKRLN